MKELEIKILNIDLDKMEKKLQAIGAKLISNEIQINTIIDSEDSYIQKELNSYLRIRESKSIIDGTVVNTLTMKKNVLRKNIRENWETNIKISDKTSMLNLLKVLGYYPIEEGVKERTSYIYKDIRFDLDKWDERTYPEPYMEVEVKNENDLEHILEILEIDKENISIKSILDLRKEKGLV